MEMKKPDEDLTRLDPKRAKSHSGDQYDDDEKPKKVKKPTKK